MPYGAMALWDELQTQIAPWLKHPEGAYRAVALATLVRYGRFDRARLPEILTALKQRGNEQDPVRSAFVTAVAELPPSLWKVEHLSGLDSIIDDGLKALDLSWLTSEAFTRLITALVPFHPEWAIPKLVKLAGNRGYLQFGNLESRWNDNDVRRLAPRLRPLLRDWLARRRYAPVISLALSLGKRVRAFPELAEILERFVTRKFDRGISLSALTVIHQHFRERRAELIPALDRQG